MCKALLGLGPPASGVAALFSALLWLGCSPSMGGLRVMNGFPPPWVFLSTQRNKQLIVPPSEAALLYIISYLLGMRRSDSLLLEMRVLLGAAIGEQPEFGSHSNELEPPELWSASKDIHLSQGGWCFKGKHHPLPMGCRDGGYRNLAAVPETRDAACWMPERQPKYSCGVWGT